MCGQTFIEEAATEPAFCLYDLGGYPGMVRTTPGLSVLGEVWEVDDRCLSRLDELESVAEAEYERVPIRLADGRWIQTYLYLRAVDHAPVVGAVWNEG